MQDGVLNVFVDQGSSPRRHSHPQQHLESFVLGHGASTRCREPQSLHNSVSSIITGLPRDADNRHRPMCRAWCAWEEGVVFQWPAVWASGGGAHQGPSSLAGPWSWLTRSTRPRKLILHLKINARPTHADERWPRMKGRQPQNAALRTSWPRLWWIAGQQNRWPVRRIRMRMPQGRSRRKRGPLVWRVAGGRGERPAFQLPRSCARPPGGTEAARRVGRRLSGGVDDLLFRVC